MIFENTADMEESFDWSVFSSKVKALLQRNKEEKKHPQNQPELGDIIGLSEVSMNRFLNPGQKKSRKKPPKVLEITAIAKALDVDFEYLWFKDCDDEHFNRTLNDELEREFFFNNMESIKFLESIGYKVVFSGDRGEAEITYQRDTFHLDRRSWDCFIDKIRVHVKYELLNCWQIYKTKGR